jgi:GDPmannose 4,6-dehydratase
MSIKWEGEGEDEIGIDMNTKMIVVRVSSRYYRPAEVETLLGDYTKAKTELGWKPEISFSQLVEDMCENE